MKLRYTILLLLYLIYFCTFFLGFTFNNFIFSLNDKATLSESMRFVFINFIKITYVCFTINIIYTVISYFYYLKKYKSSLSKEKIRYKELLTGLKLGFITILILLVIFSILLFFQI
jgi:hypothetical protein